MPRPVAIVFEPDFSRELEKLAFRASVWLVDTPSNHEAAEEAWLSAAEWPQITVTLFRAPLDEVPTSDDWLALVGQVSLRESNVEVVEVIGAPLTLGARAALLEAGMGRFEDTEHGFRAKRW